MSIENLLKERLAVLQPIYLHVQDDSEQHRGHAGAAGGAKHFTVEIASSLFQNKSKIECHRLVYQAVGDLIPHSIHALRIIIKI